MKYILQYQITNQETISSSPIIISSKNEMENSVKSRKLGYVGYSLCQTCCSKNECSGHFGKTEMNNIILIKTCYINLIEKLLKIVCYECGLLKNPSIIELLHKYNYDFKKIELRQEFNKLINQKLIKCLNPNCSESSTSYKYNSKEGKFKRKRDKETLDCEMTKIYKIIQAIPKDVLRLLTPSNSTNIISPTDVFFVNYFPILPNYSRQPNHYDNMESHAITSMLNDIVGNLLKGDKKENEIQIKFDSLDNNKGTSLYKAKKTIVTLEIQVGGHIKEGLLRSAINGKRTNGTARAVLGPGEDLDIGYIKVPRYILKVLKEKIYYNKITENYIDNLFSTSDTSNSTKLITFIKRDKSKINPLQLIFLKGNIEFKINPTYGDEFEISKENSFSSYITHGRQPSLHKWNIQSSEVIKSDDSTLQIPTTTGSSYNADYDGDEMNCNNYYSEGSNLEQGCLLNSNANLKNSSIGAPMFGLIQDQIIAIHNILKLEKINLEDVMLIMGKYSYFIKDLNKKIYSGKELLSLFFTPKINYKNIFKNGNIILDNINSIHVTPKSYDSIFNLFSQLYNDSIAISYINILCYIAQRYIDRYGFSLTINDILPNITFLKTIEEKISSMVILIENKLNEYLNDINNKTAIIFSYDDIQELRINLLNKLQRFALKTVSDVVQKNHGSNPENSLKIMEYSKYKISSAEILSLFGFVGQQANKQIPRPGINGRIAEWFLPGYIGIKETGFITSSLFSGLTFPEYIFHVKETAIPQIVNVTTGTSVTGHMGKKIVKFLESSIVNDYKMVVNNNEIINPSVNILKISGNDICKVKLIYPEEKMIWYNQINELFKNLKPYLIYDNNTKLIENINFYINMELEINSFGISQSNYENIINNENIYYLKIINFVDKLLVQYYFHLIDITWVKYILLTYLDPYILNKNEYFIENNINTHDNDIVDHILNKIEKRIKESIDPGNPIGLEYGNNIQEGFTQQNLSSFHTHGKLKEITKYGTTDFKNIVELSKKNKPDIVTCLSTEKYKIENIKNNLEFICLKDLNPQIELIEELNNICVYKIVINKNYIIIKNILVEEYFQMIMMFLTNCYIIKTFWVDINFIEDNIEVLIGIKLDEDNYNINRAYFHLSLYDGIHKGKVSNKKLKILETQIYDENLEKHNGYELSFVMESLNDFEFFDTENVILELNPWFTFESMGIEFMELISLKKILRTTGEESMYNSYKLLTSLMFGNSTPINIKKLKEKNSIIKSANHGDGNAFVNAAFYNLKDSCSDIYSSMFLNKEIGVGTGYNKIYFDLNKYDKLKILYKDEYEQKINKIDNELIISAI